MHLLEGGYDWIFLKVEDGDLPLISSQKGIELSVGMVEQNGINFELKGEISWNFVDVA